MSFKSPIHRKITPHTHKSCSIHQGGWVEVVLSSFGASREYFGLSPTDHVLRAQYKWKKWLPGTSWPAVLTVYEVHQEGGRMIENVLM